MTDPRRALDEQMLSDWAAVGLRRLEAHLALHAAFCEFLRRQSRDADDREESCPHRHAH
jgi:hypothetical protein